MLVYLMKCLRCDRKRGYKTDIKPDDFNIPICICGGKHEVTGMIGINNETN